MIDVHSHILYGIDDGAKTIEESLIILKRMALLGYKEIFVTPHYIDGTTYVANNLQKKQLLNELQEKLKEENIPLKLYLGNEIFIDENILKNIFNQNIATYNQTNYLLIEIPMNENLENDIDIFYDLIQKGAWVILAHPERYKIFQNDFAKISEYTSMGVLLQGNIESLSGKYGKDAKNLFIHLLQNKKYFVLGSDVHHSDSSFFENFSKVQKQIVKMVGFDYWDELTNKNPKLLINGRTISQN